MHYVKQKLDELAKSLKTHDDYAIYIHMVDCHIMDAEIELARYFAPKGMLIYNFGNLIQTYPKLR